MEIKREKNGKINSVREKQRESKEERIEKGIDRLKKHIRGDTWERGGGESKRCMRKGKRSLIER